MWLQWNTLIRGKGQKSVIIHDRVHGFNPVGIQITIKNNPLWILVWNVTKVSHGVGHQTIFPFSGCK